MVRLLIPLALRACKLFVRVLGWILAENAAQLPCVPKQHVCGRHDTDMFQPSV